MRKILFIYYLIVLGVCSFGCLGCDHKQDLIPASHKNVVLPMSDPKNDGGWILNEVLSDEFDGSELDTARWFIEGQNEEYYIWKGRPPSQFVPHNVNVKEGKLVITSQWEPEYEFANEI